MIDFFVYSLSMCFILFLFGTDLNILQFVLNIFVIAFNVLNMFVFCMHGNILTYEVSIYNNINYIFIQIGIFVLLSLENYQS